MALFRDQIASMMKEHYGIVEEPVSTSNEYVPKLEKLAKPIIDRVVGVMSNEPDYQITTVPGNSEPGNVPRKYARRAKRFSYGKTRNVMVDGVWNLGSISKSFNDAFDKFTSNELEQLPIPSIGLRIMPKVPKFSMYNAENLNEPFKVLLFIYGSFSRFNANLCVEPQNIASAIYPAIIESNLVIQGFTLDDGLVEMLKQLDTSKVEVVKFFDLKGIDLVDYTIPDVVNLFPSAMKVLFLGDERIRSLRQLSVEVPEMESEQMENIPHGDLTCLYHDVDPSASLCKLRRNAKRLARETIDLDDEQPVRKTPQEHYHKSINRLKRFLNDPPKKKIVETDKTNDELRKEIAGLEKKLALLQSRLQ